MRINKYIANCGICSRRAADELVLNGKVEINGDIINIPGFDVDIKDTVKINGKIIKLQDEKIYILLNKPKGYITTSEEQFGRPCIMDLIKENIRVFPVGRLDMDTEGMILLTNDGELTNNIIHPRNKIEKRYIVEIHEKVTTSQIKSLTNGVDIGGYITSPAVVKLLDDKHLEITITEGKNRQVRRMCEAVDIIVYNLKRISIGNLTLGDLKVGTYRRITENEINKIFK